MLRRLAFLFLILSLHPLASAQRVRFELVPQGGVSADDMSADGRSVVGSTAFDGPYLWDTLTDTFTLLTGGGTGAVAVSDDGQTVLGNMDNPDDPTSGLGSVGAIWKASTQSWESLGFLPNALNCPSKSTAYELSADAKPWQWQ